MFCWVLIAKSSLFCLASLYVSGSSVEGKRCKQKAFAVTSASVGSFISQAATSSPTQKRERETEAERGMVSDMKKPAKFCFFFFMRG